MRIRQWSWVWSRFAAFLSVLLIAIPLLTPAAAMQGGQAGSGLDPANMDFSVDPAEDFYRFANGGWLDRTEIPADAPSYGAFDEVQDLTDEQLLTVLNEGEAGGALQEGSDPWKVSELYRQGNDIETRNAQGIEPIQYMLDDIDAITTLEELHTYQLTAYQQWLTGLFGVSVGPDYADSTINVPFVYGALLGMPGTGYYLDDTAENETIRVAYREMVAESLMRAGYTEAEAVAAADAVYEFERRVAEQLLSPEEGQDLSLVYNPMTLSELQDVYPYMDWVAYADQLGFTDVDTLIVTERRYLEALQDIVDDTPLDVLKDFYKLEVFWSFADYLDEDLGQTAFDFAGPVFSGVTEQQPLEERTLGQVNQMMPDAIGQLYVDQYFPPEAKAEIEAQMDAEITAFRILLQNNPWMSDETRAAAIAKLDAVVVKVGYPDQWQTYESVEIGESYVETFLTAAVADWESNLAKAGEPVDREEWTVPVQTVNAFYNPQMNEIVFPAAILQPPFFEYGGDPAANFGGIGMLIGHELTHGFDLTGSQFDAEGNFVNWWTEEDYATFDALNQRVADHYGAIEILPGLNINGQMTVTENVADMGGIQIAYDALMIYLDDDGGGMASPEASPMASPVPATPQASPVVPLDVESLTPQQRFFVAAATMWREEIRDEFVATQVEIGVHSIHSLRGVVPLQHLDAFYEAFDIQPGDPMYLPPEERIVIW